MANLANAVKELVDVVEHIVGTHVHWNMDLSKDEAVAKVVAARAALLAEDVADVARDVEQGDLVQLVTDGEKLVKDAQSVVNPNV